MAPSGGGVVLGVVGGAGVGKSVKGGGVDPGGGKVGKRVGKEKGAAKKQNEKALIT